MPVNEHGWNILKKSYAAPGETCPEDIFRRVAAACVIPDIVQIIAKQGMQWPSEENTTQPAPAWYTVFEPHGDLALRCWQRSYKDINMINSSGLLPSGVKELWAAAAQKCYELMNNLDFMPATPTLINAGRAGMLSSCFFMRIGDSVEEIFSTIMKAAVVLKMGGGVGYDVSEIRPAGSPVKSYNGAATGPLSYLKLINQMGDIINQAGARKAAQMAVLRVDHPDIFEFIRAKVVEGTLANFNFSVSVTSEFMRAVEEDTQFVLRHPRSPVKKEVRARDIWETITSMAWHNGEPGVIFADTVASGDIFEGKYGALGPNPCCELLLLDKESCNLAAINLSNCVDEAAGVFDFSKLVMLVRYGIRFLDNIVDINNYPIPEIETTTLTTRRIGLGVCGLHDAMLKLGIRYGSDESLEFIDEVWSTMRSVAEQASAALGQERGIPPAIAHLGRRNAGMLTAQPTGSVSQIMNQVSSGIEPVFKLSYERRDSHGVHQVEHFILKKFVGDLPSYVICAADITPEEHIAVQAAIQKHLCASISKTINLPADATVEDVSRAFLLAYKTKCKSLTVYREGSRKQEVLTVRKEQPEDVVVEAKPPIRSRPRVLFGATFRINTPSGKAYITLNEDKEGMREVFIHVSKAGSEISTYVESNGRLISNSLKHRIPASSLISHMEGIKSNPVFEQGTMVKSVPDAVARVMQEYIEKYEGFSEFIEDGKCEEKQPTVYTNNSASGGLCASCGEPLYMESRCEVCHSCGFSRCG